MNIPFIQYVGKVLYPKGAIWISTNNMNPATIWGGEWVKITNKFLYDNSSSVGTSGGEAYWKPIAHTHYFNHEHGASTESGNHRHSYPTNSASNNYPTGTNEPQIYAYNTSRTGYFNTSYNTHGHTVSYSNITDSTSNGIISQWGDNFPSYLAVNIWKRVSY